MKRYAFLAGFLFAVLATFASQSAHAAKTATTTAVTASVTTSVYGPAVAETFTVTVTGVTGTAAPTGTITVSGSGALGTLTTFTMGSTCTSVNAFTVTCPVPATIPADTAVNVYTMTATYSGDTNNKTSAGTTTVTISRATPTLALTPTPITAAYGVTTGIALTATATGVSGGTTPGGVVTFSGTYATYGTLSSTTCTLSTGGTCSVTFTPNGTTVVGTYTAIVSGTEALNGNYKASAAATDDLTITKATPTLALTPNPITSAYGATTAISLTATATGVTGGTTPGGVVTFSGTYATYGTLSSTTCTLATGTCSVMFTPKGTTAVGTYTGIVSATEAANGNYGASAAATDNLTITAATPTLALTPNPITSAYGATTAISLTATATGVTGGTTPGGVVTFSGAYATYGTLSSTTCTLATGTCSVMFTPKGTTAVGSYTGIVSATEAAHGNYGASAAATDDLTISKSAPTAAFPNLTSTYGGTVTLTATNTGGVTAPQGAPTFKVNGTAVSGTPTCTSSGAVNTCTLSYTLPATLTPTTYTMKVAFAATGNYMGSTATGTLTVGRATATAAISSPTGYYQEKVPLTMSNTGVGSAYAAPTGAPSIMVGTVTQKANKVCTATSDVNNCTTTYNDRATQPVGTYTITVTFAQDDNYAQAVGTGTLTVTLDSSTTTVTANPQNIEPSGNTTLTASVVNASHAADVPTGTATFTDGSTNFGNCTLAAGTCSLTVAGSSLPAGREDTITGTYSGLATKIAGSTGTVLLTVPADIVFTSVSHNFGTVPVGSNATYGVQLSNNDATAFPFTFSMTGPSTITAANHCGTSVAGNSVCEIVFTYTPTAAAGVESATWSVANPNSLIFSPADGGTVTGEGVATAGVTLTTSAHDFGDQEQGTSSNVYGVVLTNGTTAAVQFTSSQNDTTDFITSGDNCPATMNAYASCNLQFYFDPQSAGFLEDFVTLNVTQAGAPVTITNGSGQTVTGITLDGTGQ